MSNNLDGLRLSIARELCNIENLLSPEYALTLVARHRTNNEAHIVVTVETDTALAVAAIQKLYGEKQNEHN